jgi:two-component system, OmpR family, sensor histidine kinase SenX3
VETSEIVVALSTAALVLVVSAVAWRLSQRQFARVPEAIEPIVPPGVASVLSVLRSSAVVVNSDNVVLKASAPAYALGLVNGNAVTHGPLRQLIDDVRRDSQIREDEFELNRSPGLPVKTVAARVAPLGGRLVLALVEDRTRERQLDDVRRDFVANVSHELKTPVGAIRLLAEAVQDGADDPEAVHRFAGRMLTESDRLSRLVQQIIELSRLQGDDPVAVPSVVHVDKVVAASVDANVIDAEAKQIAVVVAGDEGCDVLGSHEQIIVAVSNLVANAVSYSPAGSTVVVRVTGHAETVDVGVIDQGIGIPSGEINRIFERFYRVDPARHRSTGGTGLGLSIVKHVAATHGGEVRAWSVEGQGSTFTLSLPRSNEAGSQDETDDDQGHAVEHDPDETPKEMLS